MVTSSSHFGTEQERKKSGQEPDHIRMHDHLLIFLMYALEILYGSP